MSTKIVKLYGELGDKFGKEWLLDINTPAEAIRAIDANTGTFLQYFADNYKGLYHIFVEDKDIDIEEAILPIGNKRQVIKIVPAIAGSGGFFKVLAGVALFALGGGFGVLGVGGVLGEGIGVSLLGENVFGFLVNKALTSIGTSLIFGGVSELLTSPPKPQEPVNRPDGKPSFQFIGAANTITQGNAVPVCYGRLIVGSAVISAGISAEEL